MENTNFKSFKKTYLLISLLMLLIIIMVGCSGLMDDTELPEETENPDNPEYPQEENYASSVTQYGVTWYFDREYQVGQFANGDWWVLTDEIDGEVTIESVDPAPQGDGSNYRNGTMVNPIPGGRQGYDGRANGYDEELSVSFPLSLSADSSVISAISRGDDECMEPPEAGLYGNDCSRGRLATAAVLTILDSQPPADALRPAYCGVDKVIHRAGSINIDHLPSLSSVSNTPALENYERGFQRVWLDHVLDWSGQYIRPNDNMPSYGRDMTRHIGDAFLLLTLSDIGDRELLAIYLTQLGIDLYGIVENGGYWPPNGGHNGGRKLPILFAGWMLYDSSGEGPANSRAADMYNIGSNPVQFQEDEQTFYITETEVGSELKVTECRGYATSATANTIGVYHPEEYAQLDDLWIEIVSGPGQGQRRYITESTVSRTGGAGVLTVDRDWDILPVVGESEYQVKGYESFHIGMPEWGIKGKGNTWCSPSWGAEYRELNGYSYPGIALAAQLFGLKEQWNHDALFDYQDRYMVYRSPEGLHPGNRSLSGFAGNMWDSYRSNIPGTAATPPFAAVVTPGDTSTLSGNINIKAIAYGINGINSVQFYLNGNEIGSEVTDLSEEHPRSYNITWNTEEVNNDSHELTVIASDLQGNTFESKPISIDVEN